jgi:hypothetical protein
MRCYAVTPESHIASEDEHPYDALQSINQSNTIQCIDAPISDPSSVNMVIGFGLLRALYSCDSQLVGGITDIAAVCSVG